MSGFSEAVADKKIEAIEQKELLSTNGILAGLSIPALSSLLVPLAAPSALGANKSVG